MREIRDADVGEHPKEGKIKKRDSTRCILFDGDKVALLWVQKRNRHEFPGGGMKEDEELEEGLRREVQEETGCTIKNVQFLDKVDEYRTHKKRLRIDHCYVADVESKGERRLTKKEQKEGSELRWYTLEEAKQLISADEPNTYAGKFIKIRELHFIEQYDKAQKNERSSI